MGDLERCQNGKAMISQASLLSREGQPVREFLFVGVGAVLGANLRYWVTNYFAARLGLTFPYGTLFINISGSFLLGFVLTLLANRLVADPAYRLLIGTGFMGAYTTFSTFSFDTITLLE